MSDGPQHDELLPVRILQAPLQLWEELSQHTEELLRELALVLIGAEQGLGGVPARLTALVDELRARYGGVAEEPTQRRQAALAAGQTAADLEYLVPPSTGQALRELRNLLEEADGYCRSGHLVTLPPTPDQRRFRDWYVGEFLRQLAGEPPVAWPDAPPSGTSVPWGP